MKLLSALRSYSFKPLNKFFVSLLSGSYLFSSQLLANQASTQTAAKHSSVPKANPALASIQDIVPPEAISTFPSAPGYYFSAALILLTITAIIMTIYRRHQRLASLREARVQIQSLSFNDNNVATLINALIKRVLLSYLPREEIAQLSGNNWQQWLNAQLTASQLSKFDSKLFHHLLASRYQSAALSPQAVSQLQALSCQWLNLAIPRISKNRIAMPVQPQIHSSQASNLAPQEESSC